MRITWPDIRSRSEGWAVEPRVIGDEVMAARTLLADESIHSTVRVVNVTDVPHRIHKGTFIGKAEAVEVCVALEAIPARVGTVTCESSHGVGDGSAHAEEVNTDGLSSHIQSMIDNFPPKLNEEQRQQATEFVLKNADLFSKSEFDLRHTDLLEHTIDTGNHRPFRQPLRRHPVAHLEVIDDRVYAMLKNDLIEPTSNSAWASNVVLVKKQDGGLRFCVDYRRLNSITHRDSFPLPRIDSCLDSL